MVWTLAQADWVQTRKFVKHLMAGMTGIKAEQRLIHIEAHHRDARTKRKGKS